MKRLGMILLLAVATWGQETKSRAEQDLEAQLSAMKAREAQLSAVLSQLRQQYTETFPDVVSMKQQLQSIQREDAALQDRLGSLRGPRVIEHEVDSPHAPDRWWHRASTVQSLNLTSDQQKKMDDVFQQFRVKLIDANAALQRAEAALDPLVSAEPLDDAKVSAQIDRVAQARAELEKTNGRMLLGIRKLLTPAQWTKLNASYSGGGSVLEQALK
jgi:Spy/CpxP family protein refolding chaperone